VVSSFHCEYAWLGGQGAQRGVRVNVANGCITEVASDTEPLPEDYRLPGLVLPGLINTHSHVFHRAIRGHTETGAADFWRWRDLMYRVAVRITPDQLYLLARATYAEMALAGITTVGEFHYLHHGPDGQPYDDPNTTAAALAAAANEAGIRLTLLDTCYLQADVDGAPLAGPQLRFGDGSWAHWADRIARLRDGPGVRIGAAIHSVRAVPRLALAPVAGVARERSLPLHAHLSEQPAENAAALAAFGRTPTQLLAEAGAFDAATTVVHATHLTDADIRLLGSGATSVSLCVTTERDLADGVGPAPALAAAGCPLVVGTDGHMHIDLLAEARGVELDERLVSGRRGHFSPATLATMLTSAGAASLGWDTGRIAVGALADLTAVALDTPRTAGARAGDPLAPVLFAAGAADVHTVVVGGEVVVGSGAHRTVDVGPELDAAIRAVLAND
jgi:formiminoglutamate deiminase